MNFNNCFRHFVSLKLTSFGKIFKTGRKSLQYSVNNLVTKFLSTCYSNVWWILSYVFKIKKSTPTYRPKDPYQGRAVALILLTPIGVRRPAKRGLLLTGLLRVS